MRPLAASLIFAAAPWAAASAESEAGGRAVRAEITAEIELSVKRGFEHLVRKQSVSGEFDSSFPVAANALAGLAFLAGGYTRTTGPEKYAKALREGTSALLRYQNRRGYFDDGKSRMYGHGFATLYLAELYGTAGSSGDDVRGALKSAIGVIEGSQAADGGWDYDPAPQFSESSKRFSGSDTSITVCQTLALRAARNLGIRVDGSVVANARRYIANAQNSDGGFRYRQGVYGEFFTASAFPRSAAGVCVLYSLGDYNSPAIRRGFEYLYTNYRLPWSNPFPFYAHYYCAQAMFQAGGKYWRDYFPWISRELMSGQRSDGSWAAGQNENSTQATAMALIVLQLPYRFLPIHER
ncbi:MAG: prenyltransferase/squalene oxidase repeat-containing protein [Planctomycetota bacterium]